MKKYHIPVMSKESITALNIKPHHIYVDATLGGGGHTRLILQEIGNTGKLIVFDRDEDAKKNIPSDPRIYFAPVNYKYLTRYLKYYRLFPVHGILADLGVSSFQLDQAERGFSYRFDGPLDMRMSKNTLLTASEVINSYSEDQLKKILQEYADIPNAYKIARHIKNRANNQKISTTGQLTQVLSEVAPKFNEYPFYSKIFQALRIEVNDEFDSLNLFLHQCADCLDSGGRLVVITYHSVEDRMVKNLMKTGNTEGIIKKDIYGNILNPYKKVQKDLIPSDAEIASNPRSRSARLRVAEKK